MRAATLDRRVRKEARLLVRDARAALIVRPGLTGKAGDLTEVTDDVDRGLAAGDLQRVRRALPVLDALVDELVKPQAKSTTRDYIESIGAAILIALALRACVIEAFKIPSSSMYPTLEIGDHIFVNKFIYGVRIPWTKTKFFQIREPRRGEVIVFMQPCEPERDYIKRVVALAGDTVEVRCNVVHINGAPIQHDLIEAETCKYDDYDDINNKWFTRLCSRYRETVDGVAYEVYHDVDRPLRDERLTTGALLQGDDRDFPRLDGVRLPPSCATNPDGEALAAPNQKPGTLAEDRREHNPGVCERQLHYTVPDGHVFVMGDNRANSNDSRIWGSVPIENIKGKALFIWLSYSHWGPTDWSGIRFHRVGNYVH
ncbi:MAG: signal peptidase I [Deltaproteobacteria bacterium]|nr:signal peptidase I [Deltaproteobacteria bacterium]